jgi:hypothetical protein
MKQPTAVVHKHHHHRTFLKSGLVMFLALKLNAIANVVLAVQLRFGAHELAVGRQVKVWVPAEAVKATRALGLQAPVAACPAGIPKNAFASFACIAFNILIANAQFAVILLAQ